MRYLFSRNMDGFLKTGSVPKVVSIQIADPAEPVQNKHSGEVETFLVSWFNIAYYFGLSPFRLRLSESLGNPRSLYEVHRNFIQRVICGISHTLALIVYFSELHLISSCVIEENRNPVDYLTYFFKITSVVHHITFIHLLWAKADQFVDAVNYLKASNSYSLFKQLETPSKWFPYSICLFFFVFAVLSMLIGNAAKPQNLIALCDWAPKTRSILFLPGPPDFFQLLFEFNFADFLLFTFYWIMSVARRIMAHGLDALVIMICLTLWYPSKAFSKRGADRQISVILYEYETLKYFSKKINAITRKLIFTFVMEAVLFYSIGMKPVILWKATGGSIIVLLVSFFACFFLACDVCEQVDWMRTWLSNASVREQFENSGEVTFLLQELDRNPVSLSGNGIFVINHNLAKSICASLLTYFVVTVQFDNNAKTTQ